MTVEKLDIEEILERDAQDATAFSKGLLFGGCLVTVFWLAAFWIFG